MNDKYIYLFIQTLGFTLAMASWQFFLNSKNATCTEHQFNQIPRVLHTTPIQANIKVKEFKYFKSKYLHITSIQANISGSGN